MRGGGSEKGKPRNPGLAQGFVRSNSVAWQVLKFIYVHGTVRSVMIQEALNIDRHLAGMVLSRLVKYKFIFRVGVASQVTTGEKTASIYALTDRKKKIKCKPLTPAERQRRCREKQKIKVPSVFAFRGAIPVTGDGPAPGDTRTLRL